MHGSIQHLIQLLDVRKMSSFGDDFETTAGNAFGIAATILKIHNSVAGTSTSARRTLRPGSCL
jgi:hypothetical protein